MDIDSDSPPRYVPEDLESLPLAKPSSSDDRLFKVFYEGGRVAPPLDDEKYLDNKEFHYTSSFQIRPQVEYFDFDERYMFKPNGESRETHGEADKNRDGLSQNDDSTNRASHEALPGVVEDFQKERNDFISSRDAYLDGMMTKVDLCKDAFKDLIGKIDGTTFSTTPYRNTKQDVSVTKEISDLLSLVNHNNILQPLIARKIGQQQAADAKGVSKPTSVIDAPGRLSKLLRDDPCASLPNFGVILLKSPVSIAQLWDEYTKVPSEWPVTDILSFTRQQGILNNASNIDVVAKRKTSIRQLEELLGSSWRNDDKNFSRQINRRKKIWKAIEDGLRDGVPLQECFSILETYVKERNKGLSWYYNGVPFAIAAIASSNE